MCFRHFQQLIRIFRKGVTAINSNVILVVRLLIQKKKLISTPEKNSHLFGKKHAKNSCKA